MPAKYHITQMRLKYSVLLARCCVLVHFFAPMPEAPRGVPARKEMAEQDIEYTLHMHRCWTKKMKNLFQHAHLGMQNPSMVMV